MKRLIKLLIVGALTLGFILAGFGSAGVNAAGIPKPEGFVTPYEKYGKLKVVFDSEAGYPRLCDKDGKPVQLKGVSLPIHSDSENSWIDYAASYDSLAYDFKCDFIRIALDSIANLETFSYAINTSINKGLYVIIDLRSLNLDYLNAITSGAAGVDNILFEVSSLEQLQIIREKEEGNTPNIVIIDTDDLSNAPVIEDNQILYSVHFNSETDDFDDSVLKTEIENALESGKALFCDEWSTAKADSTTGPYINNSEKWLGYLEEMKIGWCYSSLTNTGKPAEVFKTTAKEEPEDTDSDGIPNWDYSTDDSNKDLTISGIYLRAKLRGDETPVFGNELMLFDFQSGVANCVRIDDQNHTLSNYDFSVKSISDSNKALYLSAIDTEGEGAFGDKGVRLKFNTTATYTPYRRLTFKVYIESLEDLVDDQLVIYPVFVSPTLNWWGQTTSVTLTADDFSQDPETGLLVAYVDSDYTHVLHEGTDKLDNMVLLIGDTKGFYIDDIALTSCYNGDYEDRPLPPYNAGKFIGFPMTFESDSRESWRPDGNTKMDHTTITLKEVIEGDHALTFPLKLKVGKNTRGDGARLTTDQNIFDSATSKTYDAFAMNVYLEKGKATTGSLVLAVASVPNEYPYWYESGEQLFDPLKEDETITTPDGKELLKYCVYIPLNNITANYCENPFDAGYLRNIVLIISGDDTDYNGLVYYDNIRYVDAQNLDNIDKEYNYNQHADILLPLAAKEEGKVHHAEEAILVIEDALFTPEILERNDVSLADILDNLTSINNNTLQDIMELYTEINNEKIKNDDLDAYKDAEKMKEVCKDLGATDNQIKDMIDPLVEALLKDVKDLKDANATLSDEIDDKKQELQDKTDELDEIQKNVDAKDDDLKKLNDEADKTAKEIDKLKEDIKKLEEEKAAQDAKIAEQEALIKKLQDDAGSSETPDKPGTTDKSEVTLKVGDEVVVGKGVYKITAVDEVTFTGPTSSKLKKFTIDSTVKLIDGKEYKVTAIAANAFKANKKLANVTIGENVASIGKNAFNGCKKLKTITVKTELLTTKNVGAGAFKGIKKKATFKVPASMKKAYKKLFSKKGAKKPKVK
ncbi:MAG: leucine-rich repeat protein [Eubacterium sp.]|nr:leucine-rich repeat protein [Eubacterium sp.]